MNQLFNFITTLLFGQRAEGEINFYGQNICVHTQAFYCNSLHLNVIHLIFLFNLTFSAARYDNL